jgi:ATP-dependent helicase HrpB
MAALGNDPRLAAMLVAAQGDDEIATAAKLAAILEEPPRGGSSDLGQAFSRNQGNWQQRAQQLCKRLNSRGGAPDSDKIAFCWRRRFRTGLRVGAGWTVATSWQTAWGRCWTAMMP